MLERDNVFVHYALILCYHHEDIHPCAIFVVYLCSRISRLAIYPRFALVTSDYESMKRYVKSHQLSSISQLASVCHFGF